MLDVTAYLIARTVGLHSSHPSRETDIPSITVPPKSKSQTSGPTIIISSSDPSQIAAPLSKPPSPTSQIRFPLHFTTPSEGANFKLSGDGLFSPPESRSTSPSPLDGASRMLKNEYRARKRATSVGVEALGVITDDDDDTTSTSSGDSQVKRNDSLTVNGDGSSRSLRKRGPKLTFTPMAS
ncbi:hypothetical protein FRB98_009645 [Tulasnella sp. 332]|nr:hypothetical protein FRB98_009645 [Tulasnella sp. 332]